MIIFWIIVIGLVLIYVYNQDKFTTGPYKKQAIDIIKSFIHLCHSYPKKMDKGFINSVEITLIDQINNKKNFEQWIENEAKKLGSIEIAIYNDIQQFLGTSLALSDIDDTDIRKKRYAEWNQSLSSVCKELSKK